MLGQWSGWVTFPAPESEIWPRHGHLRGILDGFQGRQPNFQKWARPAWVLYRHSVCCQEKLPFACSLATKCTRPWKLKPDFVRPAIHGFGTSAKRRLPTRLTELAQFGWLPLAAALFGTTDWKQWLHHNFLPVLGLRLHAKVPPPPLTHPQLVVLLGLWERGVHRGQQCRALVLAAELAFGIPTVFQTTEKWQTVVKGQTFDLGECAQRIYTGALHRSCCQ